MGNPRVTGALTETSPRKRAQEELRISEEKFSKAFYLSPDAITITRLNDGMIVSVNDGFRKSLDMRKMNLSLILPRRDMWTILKTGIDGLRS